MDSEIVPEKEIEPEREIAPWLASRLRAIAAVIAGWASVMALVVLWHLLGFASHNSAGEGYPYTTYLVSSVNVLTVGLYLLLSGLLGAGFRRVWSVALGMALPWPMACAIEMTEDPTSHNLLPFDVISWVAYFALALMGAYIGRLVLSRMRDTATQGLFGGQS